MDTTSEKRKKVRMMDNKIKTEYEYQKETGTDRDRKRQWALQQT